MKIKARRDRKHRGSEMKGKDEPRPIAAAPAGLDVSVSIRVDMREFAGWQPAQLQAFFRGVAQVAARLKDLDNDYTSDRARKDCRGSL